MNQYATPSGNPRAELFRSALYLIESAAPCDTADDRYEALAWASLLRAHRETVLDRRFPTHFTASAVILSPDRQYTCLVLHGRIELWVQPGGHLEPGDRSLEQAAAREALEETGLSGEVSAAPIKLSRHYAPCAPHIDWHLDVQFALTAAKTEPRLSAESKAVQWWPVNRLPAELAQGVAESVRRAVHS